MAASASAASGKAFDYVIVGSGAGGSVLAYRLSRNPANSVLLIEAGGGDKNPMHLVPKGFYFTSANPKYAKKFVTEKYGNGAFESWHRGRVLGGSTTINGMVWNRGWAPDYDKYEEAGNRGWNWEAFREAFRRLENHELGGTEFRGDSGPIGVSVAGPRDAACDSIIASMEANGIRHQADMNASDDDRVSYVASNVKNGFRAGGANALIGKVKRRKNLTVVLSTEVDKLIFEGTRAVGVDAVHNGERVSYFANKEVLLAAGAFDTPLLLERSGIGNPEVLKAAGIPVRVASPNVGENLSEHRGIEFQVMLKGLKGFNHQLRNAFVQGWTGFKYLFTRSGVMAHGGFAVSGIYNSDPATGRPDTQVFFTPISTSKVNPMSGKMVVDKTPGAKYVTFPLHPTSTGSIHVTGPNLSDAPKLIPNFLATEHDRALLLKAARKARKILSTPPFGSHVVEEVMPGPAVETDEQILDFALNKGKAGYHTLGTCAMGPNDDDVIDENLKVRGVDGLRVVDASSLRWQPSGNCAAPVMALAMIAADRILADADMLTQSTTTQ